MWRPGLFNALMIHDICDYCLRQFGYEPGAKAICMSCGLENVRANKIEKAVKAVPERAVKERAVTAPRAYSKRKRR